MPSLAWSSIRRWGVLGVVGVFAVAGLAVGLVRPHSASLATSAPQVSVPAQAKPPTPQQAGGRPNVVVVMADDMRADELRYMPSLRAAVGEHGLSFQNSFSPFPLCCPARASFLTGRYAHNHRVYWHEAPYGYGAFDDSRTLATSLRAAGYSTGFIGKYLNRYGPDRSKVSGKPSYKYVPRGWTDWRASIDAVAGVGVHGSTYNYMDTPFNVNGRVDNRYRGRYQSHVIGDFSVDMARDFSRRAKPFFMYVNYVAPHFGGPNEPDDPPLYMVDDKGNQHEMKTPARPPGVRGRFDGLITRGAGMPKGGGPSEPDISDKPKAFSRLPEPNALERRALAEVTRQRAEAIYVMDQQVKRLVRELKRSGEWSDTVFMFTSDNGYYLGEHRRRSGKVRAHEPSLRVPFLVTGPGMRAKASRFDPITTIDVSASILDLTDALPPREADGTSRVPTMLQGDQGWSVPVLNEAIHTEGAHSRSPGFRGPRTSIGIRTARYSYIRNRTDEHELYDLSRDPLQQENVYGRPGYAEVEHALHQVWWRTRNCVGPQCRVALPPELSAGPEAVASLTTSYWERVRRVYGF